MVLHEEIANQTSD